MSSKGIKSKNKLISNICTVSYAVILCLSILAVGTLLLLVPASAVYLVYVWAVVDVAFKVALWSTIKFGAGVVVSGILGALFISIAT